MKRTLKKGFTLVELIVVLMLMGLITTCIVMIIRPSNRLYSSLTTKSTEETALITVGDYINGELRYATAVKIYCNDGTNPTGSETSGYKNFIKLSNDIRSTSNKKARGLATHGLTSNFSGAVPCVSGSLFEEFDVQFSLAGIVTKSGKQAITIGMDAHPMKMNDNGVGFSLDTTKPYNYTETFQLVNMQKTVGKVIGGIAPDVYDESSDNTIWIFYQKPAEAKDNTTSSTPSSSSGSSSIVAPTPSSSIITPIFSIPDPSSSTPDPSSSSTDTSIPDESSTTDESYTDVSYPDSSSEIYIDSSSEETLSAQPITVFIHHSSLEYDAGNQWWHNYEDGFGLIGGGRLESLNFSERYNCWSGTGEFHIKGGSGDFFLGSEPVSNDTDYLEIKVHFQNTGYGNSVTIKYSDYKDVGSVDVWIINGNIYVGDQPADWVP